MYLECAWWPVIGIPAKDLDAAKYVTFTHAELIVVPPIWRVLPNYSPFKCFSLPWAMI